MRANRNEIITDEIYNALSKQPGLIEKLRSAIRNNSAAAEADNTRGYSSPARNKVDNTGITDIQIRAELESFFQNFVSQNSDECGLYLSNNLDERLHMILECICAKYNIQSNHGKLEILEESAQKLYINDEGKYVFNRNTVRNTTYIYVWTKSGIFLAEYRDSANHNRYKTRHTSLAFGKKVLCAGEIKFAEGSICEINNCSGHYRPSPQHLANFRSFLLGKIKEANNIDFKISNSNERDDTTGTLDPKIQGIDITGAQGIEILNTSQVSRANSPIEFSPSSQDRSLGSPSPFPFVYNPLLGNQENGIDTSFRSKRGRVEAGWRETESTLSVGYMPPVSREDSMIGGGTGIFPCADNSLALGNGGFSLMGRRERRSNDPRTSSSSSLFPWVGSMSRRVAGSASSSSSTSNPLLEPRIPTTTSTTPEEEAGSPDFTKRIKLSQESPRSPGI